MIAVITHAEVWLAALSGIVLGGFAMIAFFLVALLCVGLGQPRRSIHRQTARELNQALVDYFGTRELDENDALLVRLRAAAHAHYEALVVLDRHDNPEAGDRGEIPDAGEAVKV